MTVIVAEAPGPILPRLQAVSEQVPCDGVTETSFARYVRSETLTTFTSAAATEEAFVTLIVQVMFWPSRAVVGCAVFSIARSTCSPGGVGGGVGSGGVGGCGGGSGGVGGIGGSGGSGGFGVGGVVIRRFVKVQTTKSPFATAPSTLVPLTESSWVPFRLQVIVES
jgi:hypothetical protein